MSTWPGSTACSRAPASPRRPSAPTSCTTAGATSPAGRHPRRAPASSTCARAGGRTRATATGRSRPRPRASSRPTSTPTTPTSPHGARAATRAATRRSPRWGRSRQDAAESTKAVLVYTSEPLAADVTLAGSVEVVLHAASTAGRHRLRRAAVRGRPGRDCSRNLQEGLVRGRYRNGFEAPEPLVPGEPVEYRLRLGPVGIRIPRGYRLRSTSRAPTSRCGIGTSTRAARSARRAPRPAGWRCRRSSTTRPARRGSCCPVLGGSL